MGSRESVSTIVKSRIWFIPTKADCRYSILPSGQVFRGQFPPTEFEIVPLGGTIEKPEPLPGNKIGKLFIARVDVALNEKQEEAREALVKEIENGTLDPYLLKTPHWSRRT